MPRPPPAVSAKQTKLHGTISTTFIKNGTHTIQHVMMLISRKQWSRNGLKRLLIVGSSSVLFFLTSTYWSLKSTSLSRTRRTEADLRKDALNVWTFALFLVNIKMCKEECLRSLQLPLSLQTQPNCTKTINTFQLFLLNSYWEVIQPPMRLCSNPSKRLHYTIFKPSSPRFLESSELFEFFALSYSAMT